MTDALAFASSPDSPPDSAPDSGSRTPGPGLRLIAAPDDATRPVHEHPTALQVIVYDLNAGAAAAQAATILAASDILFQRGDELVEFDDSSDPPRLRTLDKTRLRVHLDRAVRWFNADGKRTKPPPDVVAVILDRAARSGWRPVRGLIDAPTLRPDGSILAAPGYDPATGLILTTALPMEPIPERPSLDDAQAAWTHLTAEALVDFPFADPMDRATTLAALLTLVGRGAYDGPTPLFGVTADRRGVGKDLLCNVMARIATGRSAASSPQPDGDAAMERYITALARSGARVVRLDNVARPLGGAALEAALTSTTWTARRLGHSDLTPGLPLSVTFFATGNRLQTTGDFARRMLPIRLTSPHEFPERRTGFRHADLLAHVTDDRAALLRDCLVILRAFHVAGRPEPPTRLGSFEAWSGVIAAAVHWVTGVDPIASQASVIETDVGEAFDRRLVEGWAALPAGTEGLAVRDAVSMILTREEFAGLRESLEGEFKSSDARNLKLRLGNRLRTMEHRVIAGRTMTKVSHDTSRDVALWAVREPDAAA